MHKPKVSMIMGVYNCQETVEESIESILHQTYENWELIICDDASTDGTYEKVLSYTKRHPERIRLIRNQQNQRLAASLNRCLAEARGVDCKAGWRRSISACSFRKTGSFPRYIS